MIISAAVSLAAHPFVVARYGADDPRVVAVTMLITLVVTTLVWVSVTFLTRPEPEATLDAFYRRVRPGGPGWVRVSERLGYGREPIPGGALAWTNWVAGIVAVYASLFGIGKLIFGDTVRGLIMLAVAAVAFAWIARSFRNDEAAPERARREAAPVAAD
jgi:Na+/proline symporter